MIYTAILVSLWLTGAAPAQDRPGEGASPEREQAAQELFDKGVRALLDQRWEEAAESFRRAIENEDYAAFHLNLAVALDGMQDQVQAREQLLLALKFGPESDPDAYRKAMDKLAAVEAKLSKVTLTCQQVGAKVSIDGQQDLFTCPGTHEAWLQPSKHVIRIRVDQQGYSRSHVETRYLSKGERAGLQLRAPPDIELMRSPWPSWMPVTVMIAGGAIAAGGGGLLGYQALREFRAYDASIKTCADAQPVDGPYICPASETEARTPVRDSGNGWRTGAAAFSIGGGAILVTGAVLFALNQPQLPPEPEGITVVPVLTTNSAGLALAFDF